MSDLLKAKHYIIDLEEQKRIQLEILDAVDAFCRQENIKYSIFFGTLLGAVRHKGYIPWDDDIDIAMDRDNYNRFISLFPDSLNGLYKLASISNVKSWHAPFSKVYDSSTVVVDELAKTFPIGISIDIFPCDEVPDDIKERRAFLKRQRLIIKLNALKVAKISGANGFAKKIAVGLCKFLLLPIPRRFLLMLWVKHTVKNNGKGFKNAFCVAYFSTAKHAFSKDVFSEVVLWPFEDRLYYGFKDANHYLNAIYGDYMKLPPKEKQVQSHHVLAYKISI